MLQLIFFYLIGNFFFLGGGGMVMYANKVETKGKEILQILNKLQHISD